MPSHRSVSSPWRASQHAHSLSLSELGQILERCVVATQRCPWEELRKIRPCSKSDQNTPQVARSTLWLARSRRTWRAHDTSVVDEVAWSSKTSKTAKMRSRTSTRKRRRNVCKRKERSLLRKWFCIFVSMFKFPKFARSQPFLWTVNFRKRK